MDTDVELKNTIVEWTLHEAFYVFETERNIATGLGFGAVKGHDTVKAMLDFYEDKHFVVNGKARMVPCPAGNTEGLIRVHSGFKRNGITQVLDKTLILSCGDYAMRAVHYGTATWVDYYGKGKSVYKDMKIKTILRDYKIFDFVEKRLGKKATYMYTFLVYDLLEMGLGYYIRRALSKIKGI